MADEKLMIINKKTVKKKLIKYGICALLACELFFLPQQFKTASGWYADYNRIRTVKGIIQDHDYAKAKTLLKKYKDENLIKEDVAKGLELKIEGIHPDKLVKIAKSTDKYNKKVELYDHAVEGYALIGRDTYDIQTELLQLRVDALMNKLMKENISEKSISKEFDAVLELSRKMEIKEDMNLNSFFVILESHLQKTNLKSMEEFVNSSIEFAQRVSKTSYSQHKKDLLERCGDYVKIRVESKSEKDTIKLKLLASLKRLEKTHNYNICSIDVDNAILKVIEKEL